MVCFDVMKACTAISLDSRVRYFLIFEKFLSWLKDDLQMSETYSSNNMLSSSTTPRLLALAVVVSLSLPILK